MSLYIGSRVFFLSVCQAFPVLRARIADFSNKSPFFHAKKHSSKRRSPLLHFTSRYVQKRLPFLLNSVSPAKKIPSFQRGKFMTVVIASEFADRIDFNEHVLGERLHRHARARGFGYEMLCIHLVETRKIAHIREETDRLYYL